MIVKIKAEGKSKWSYFEGNNIVQEEIDLSNTDANQVRDTIFFLRKETKMNQKEEPCACGKSHSLGVLLWIQKESVVVARIITNRPTFLMNDSGKTVDRLF